MKHPALLAVIAAVSALSISSTFASDMASPLGTWTTVDDNTGKARGVVVIEEVNGELRGKVIKSFPKPGDPAVPMCDKCDGERKGKPVIGMTFMWGLKKDGDEFKGGEILDPESGSIYKAKMKLEDGGKKLVVRGYIGTPLLGRSQTWLRGEN